MKFKVIFIEKINLIFKRKYYIAFFFFVEVFLPISARTDCPDGEIYCIDSNSKTQIGTISIGCCTKWHPELCDPCPKSFALDNGASLCASSFPAQCSNGRCNNVKDDNWSPEDYFHCPAFVKLKY